MDVIMLRVNRKPSTVSTHGIPSIAHGYVSEFDEYPIFLNFHIKMLSFLQTNQTHIVFLLEIQFQVFYVNRLRASKNG